jgi:exopolysaccharide biosynthesis polyprenyl glycosylphosphotransferase
MFDRHHLVYSRLMFTADVLATVPALAVAYFARYYLVMIIPPGLRENFNPELLPFSEYLVYLMVFLPAWIVALLGTQKYSNLIGLSIRRQIVRILNFFILVSSFLGFAVFVLSLEISRPVFAAFLLLLLLILPLNRILFHLILISRNLSEHSQVRILVAGTGEKAARVAESLKGARKWGYRVIGFIEVEDGIVKVDPANVICEDFMNFLQDGNPVDEVIFAGDSADFYENSREMVSLCVELGIKIRVATELPPPVGSSDVSIEYLDNLPLLTYSTTPEQGFSLIVKRLLDLAIASVSLIILSPFILIISILIKMTSPGPVFYRQERLGLYGRKFTLVKFRTMIDGAEDKLWEIVHLNEMDGPVFKMKKDPRITKFGSILRKTSIDEIPQFWNVIKGEMSIVGPRAALPEEVRNYLVNYRRRLSVKPGMTCLWQVSGRNEIDFEQWMKMDLEYIDNWSVWLDLAIILRTVPAVFSGRGAS